MFPEANNFEIPRFLTYSHFCGVASFNFNPKYVVDVCESQIHINKRNLQMRTGALVKQSSIQINCPSNLGYPEFLTDIFSNKTIFKCI